MKTGILPPLPRLAVGDERTRLSTHVEHLVLFTVQALHLRLKCVSREYRGSRDEDSPKVLLGRSVVGIRLAERSAGRTNEGPGSESASLPSNPRFHAKAAKAGARSRKAKQEAETQHQRQPAPVAGEGPRSRVGTRWERSPGGVPL